MNSTTSNRFIRSSNRNSAASPVKVSGPLRLYSLLVTGKIVDSSRTQAEFHSLLRAAEIVYGRRDAGALTLAADSLLKVQMRQAQDAGRFYKGILAKREGDPMAAQVFESLVDCSDYRIRARSMQALGTIHFEAMRFDEAARLHSYTLRSEDLFTRANALFQLSFIKSEQGDYKHSLATLNDMWPMVRHLSREHPHLFYYFHNHIACDLLALDRAEEARSYSQIAVTWSHVESYPEWNDTAAEVEAATERVVILAVPAQQTEQRPQQKVIIRFQIVESRARRTVIKPTTGRAPIICSMVERVATVAPIHAPPAF